MNALISVDAIDVVRALQLMAYVIVIQDGQEICAKAVCLFSYISWSYIE